MKQSSIPENGIGKYPIPRITKKKELEAFLSTFPPAYLRQVYMFWMKEDDRIVSCYDVLQKNNKPRERQIIPVEFLIYFFKDRFDLENIQKTTPDDENGDPFMDPRLFMVSEASNNKTWIEFFKDRIKNEKESSQNKREKKKTDHSKNNGTDTNPGIEKKFYYSSLNLESYVNENLPNFPAPSIPEVGGMHRNKMQTMAHYTSEEFLPNKEDLLNLIKWSQDNYHGI